LIVFQTEAAVPMPDGKRSAERESVRNRTGRSIRALLEGSKDDHSAFEAIFASSPVRDSKRDSRVVDCDDPFADLETQLALKWLIGDIDGDIWYNFARVLLSEEVQRNFQRHY